MFDHLVTTRRSIRKYLPRPIEDNKMEKLVETALRSPSSMGRNPWEFIFVTDHELLTKLASSKEHGSSFLKEAPLGIVVCADPQKCDVWIEDASIASIYIHLAAHDMGLGSCWIQIRDRMHNSQISAQKYVCQILSIPENLAVESIIAVGYSGESKAPHNKNSLQYEKIHLNSYRKPFTQL